MMPSKETIIVSNGEIYTVKEPTSYLDTEIPSSMAAETTQAQINNNLEKIL